ncbi:MAG TPA: DUF4287 domain-containing protein [Thermoanaerobaculia bacterium]|nr:DUF4287 domain-containing protein [Thermoanaerobaculia bacterium]
MTLQKKLKKTIRARSEKTGESYTAARRQVLLAREKSVPEELAAPAAPAVAIPEPPAPPMTPAKGEVNDESARKKTGHGLDHWFAVLDAFGAAAKGHTATAAYLHQEHGVPGWHSQGITVAYERARGLRERNQSCTGSFQVSVSKTVATTVDEVAEALRNAEHRNAWLQGSDPALIEAIEAAFKGAKPREVKTKGNYAWLRFPWDGSTVEIRITAKPKGGASVVADNQNVGGLEQVEQRRAQWRVALAGLKQHLDG